MSPSVHGNSPSRSDWLPLDMRTTPPAAMPAFRGFEEPSADGVVHLGEGIAVCEEQLRAVKWSDYRKLTRGLAAILFSPTELATCSVTGQRWSRAGTATERPVKPALDKAKVQAIIYQTNTIRNFNFYFENGENIFGDLMKMNLERISTNSTTMFPHLKRALGKRSGQACVPKSIEFSRAKINIVSSNRHWLRL
ncbi:broad-complex core protein isoforms 1/2/3/4/5 isoform X1, partial [Vespula squamosa]